MAREPIEVGPFRPDTDPDRMWRGTEEVPLRAKGLSHFRGRRRRDEARRLLGGVVESSSEGHDTADLLAACEQMAQLSRRLSRSAPRRPPASFNVCRPELNALWASLEQELSGRMRCTGNVSLQPKVASVMPEPILPLPCDHVFVLQLQESRGRAGTCRAGRVEHLSSGEATRFATTKELWDFVDKVLTESTRMEE